MEEARRLQASDVVAQIFDDNLLSDQADPIGYGAGPIVDFADGAGDPRTVCFADDTVAFTSVYKPQRSDGSLGLNINLNNSIEGDMVAGGGYNPDADHSEDNNYNRADFTPDARQTMFFSCD